MTCWFPMDSAPTDGTLVDLNFNGIRHIDCRFDASRNVWTKQHGYPSSTKVFLTSPDGWMPRPTDIDSDYALVMPYMTDSKGNRYIP